MLAHFTHKNYYIDVHITRDSYVYASELFRPTVKVCPEDGKDIVNIGTSLVFADEKDAEACGFELGRNWIDNWWSIQARPSS